MITATTTDLGDITERLQRVAREMLDTFAEQRPVTLCAAAAPLPVLIDALEQWLVRLPAVPPVIAPDDLAAPIPNLQMLGNHGLHLLAELRGWTQVLALDAARDELHALILALALWLAQRGIELSTLEPVVAALDWRMHSGQSPAALEQLYRAVRLLPDSVAPHLAADPEHSAPPPWRLLVLNLATIAIHSQQPLLIEHAFQRVLELPPADATRFFDAGLAQVQALSNYPLAVRQLLETYAHGHSPKLLH